MFTKNLVPAIHGQIFDGKKIGLLGEDPKNPIVIIPRDSYLTHEQRERLVLVISELPNILESFDNLLSLHAKEIAADSGKETSVTKAFEIWKMIME